MAKNSATARKKVGYGDGQGSPKRQRKNNGQNDDSPIFFEPSTIPVFQDGSDEEESNEAEEDPEAEDEKGDERDEIGDYDDSVTLTDPEVLDCPICYNPLTSPVFQNLRSRSTHSDMINSELIPSATEKSKCKGKNCEMSRSLDGEGESTMNPKRLRRDCESTINPNVVIDENSTDEDDNEQSADVENGPLKLILDNRKVLHCSMCDGYLTVPTFQCENGHLACSFCCITLKRKECYSCQSTIGSSRCLAIEAILEVVSVKCQNSIYGCKETVTYSKMHDHQIYDCYYAPCSCPISDCKFVGTSRHLYQHVSGEHNNSVVKFQYNNFFKITVNIDGKFSVLQEEKNDDVLFILNNSTGSLGNLVSVCCIASVRKDLYYEIVARCVTGTTLKIQSSTWSSKVRSDIPSPFGFLLVPPYMFNCNGQLELEICIWGPGETPADWLSAKQLK